MLNVLSGGVTDRLVKDTDYQKQILSYKPGKNLVISDVTISADTKTASVSLTLPFFVDTIPSISFKECYIVPYDTGIWNAVKSVSNVQVSNNIVIFDVSIESAADINASHYFLVRNNYGELTLTWGGVTLKGLLSKIKHFFHREEVLA